MSGLTCELLARELGWSIREVGPGEMLVDAIGRERPDAIVVDAGDFPACCTAALEAFPRDRVIVVGPEPDERYRTVALGNGAASWVARDQLGDELVTELRAVLGHEAASWTITDRGPAAQPDARRQPSGPR